MNHHTRKNLSQPDDYWHAWQAAATAAGVSLSEWIADQCNLALSEKERKRLSERRGVGRSKQTPE